MHLSVVGCAHFVCQLPDDVSHESVVHHHEPTSNHSAPAAGPPSNKLLETNSPARGFFVLFCGSSILVIICLSFVMILHKGFVPPARLRDSGKFLNRLTPVEKTNN